MRWKRKRFRAVRIFALFPIRANGEWRWLEIVYIGQYRQLYEKDLFTSWKNARFLTKEEYLKLKRSDT